MQEIRRDEPDRVYPVEEQDVQARMEEAIADPAVLSVAVHKPGAEFVIKNGPMKGRRYRINALGQPVRVRGVS